MNLASYDIYREHCIGLNSAFADEVYSPSSVIYKTGGGNTWDIGGNSSEKQGEQHAQWRSHFPLLASILPPHHSHHGDNNNDNNSTMSIAPLLSSLLLNGGIVNNPHGNNNGHNNYHYSVSLAGFAASNLWRSSFCVVVSTSFWVYYMT